MPQQGCMTIKATPCTKQSAFKPDGILKFDIVCLFDDDEWKDSILAPNAKDAIEFYLRRWIHRKAAQGWIEDWDTNFVVQVDAWPYGYERLEEVRFVYYRD